MCVGVRRSGQIVRQKVYKNKLACDVIARFTGSGDVALVFCVPAVVVLPKSMRMGLCSISMKVNLSSSSDKDNVIWERMKTCSSFLIG